MMSYHPTDASASDGDGRPPPQTSGRGYDPSENEISPLQVAAVLLERRYLVLAWSFSFAVLIVTITLVLPRSYTVTSSFMPEQGDRGAAGPLTQMAGQFGIRVPTGDATQSPEFYAELIRSREIIARVVPDTFEARRARRLRRDTIVITGTLMDLLRLRDEEPTRRRDEAIEWLRDEAVSASTTRETGVVRLRVTTPWANVSENIAERLLHLVNDFNLMTRQSHAAAERAFIEGRLEETEERLRRAEDELKRFLETNRQIQGSPQLIFERDRLEREVQRRQQLFNSLSESYENARISEVRNTPVITIISSPELPSRPDPRGLTLKGVLGLVIGGVLGIFHSFTKEFMTRRRSDGEEDYLRLSRVWDETVQDVRRIMPGARVGRDDHLGRERSSVS